MQSKEFDAVAAAVGVAFVGASCADHSVLNPDRQSNSKRGRLIFKALQKAQQLFSEVVVFEVADGVFSTPRFGEFCAEAAPTQTVVAVRINPLDFGGVQTRDRWYLLLFRHDVVEARGAFQLPERAANQRTIKDILEPICDVDYSSVADRQKWVRRWQTSTHANYDGAHADFILPVSERQHNNFRFTAYATSGRLPTITPTPLVIWNQQV